MPQVFKLFSEFQKSRKAINMSVNDKQNSEKKRRQFWVKMYRNRKEIKSIHYLNNYIYLTLTQILLIIIIILNLKY